MSSLSWMIYAADVAVGVWGAFQGAAIITGLAAALALIPAVIARENNRNDDAAFYIKIARNLGIACTAFALVSSFIPSRTTIYMIAASEVAARSDTLAKAGGLVDPAIDLLRKKIDDALKAKP